MYHLIAKNLSKSFKKRKVVHDVSFEVQQGQVVGLLGPNGAGKTTSFYMVVGLIRADQGQVLFANQDISSWAMHLRAQAGLAYLPQEASIFRRMTVSENILSVLENRKISRNERNEILEKLLEEFNLVKIRSQLGLTLSGGERRRVEVARALALDPKFLLLDEPFAGIDPIAVGDIQEMILKLKTKKIGILITDHNVRETLKICDFGYILNQGSILESGTPEKIVQSETARRIYLGQEFHL